MEAPAYKQIEDQLRAFLGRTCRALTSHVPNALEHFVQPYFDRKVVASLDRMEIQEYCHVLQKNQKRHKERGCGVLFDRHIVDIGINRDLAYCKELRHRYAHL